METDSAPSAQPRSLARPMFAAIMLLTLSVFASIALIAVDLQRLGVIAQIQSDAAARATYRYATDLASAHASDHSHQIAAAIRSVVFLATVIGFMWWFHRAYGNLRRLGANGQRSATGWAIGSWLIPFAALWWPKQIANEIWRGGDPQALPGQNVSQGPVAALVHWWWALWLLSAFSAALSILFASPATLTVSDLRASTDWDLFCRASSIGAAILAATFVYLATARQNARARNATAPAPSSGGALRPEPV